MKKILISLLTIGIIATAGYGVTKALFSDEEVSGVKTFSTGTIDIAVDNQNPWTGDSEYTLNEMKPSYTGYIEFIIKNVGTNPANVWKTLTGFTYDDPDGTVSEPECKAEGGTWNDANNPPCPDRQAKYYIDHAINYDLRVELSTDSNNLVWWETIYLDSDEVKMNTLKNEKMYLGMIPAKWSMKVTQSYHMVDVIGFDMNKYQSDSISFNINLYAEQLTNKIGMVRKNEPDTDVSHHIWNGGHADFSYKVMDDKLRWELETFGVTDSNYTLIVWDNSDHSYTWEWNHVDEAVVLAHITDSVDQTYSGEYDPIEDITNAKVWLVPGTYGTVGSPWGVSPWDATIENGTYFETGLIDFYDSN